MNDYSEVTCHLQKDVVNLINALNDKEWEWAAKYANEMALDLHEVANFANERVLNESN